MQHVDRIRIQHSLIIGLLFLTGIWSVKLIEWAFHLDLAFLGILPLHAKGLAGILTAPLIHADFGHAGANSIPIFVSAALIWYFYRPVAWQVFSLIWIITGLGVWGFARESYHIGASGLVYGYIAFLFFSGILRRNLQLMAISMLMVFLYGGLIWGIFPEFFPERNISWESHLMGGLAGLIIAFVYKKYSVPRKMYSWEIEPEEEEDEDDEQPWNNTHIN